MVWRIKVILLLSFPRAFQRNHALSDKPSRALWMFEVILGVLCFLLSFTCTVSYQTSLSLWRYRNLFTSHAVKNRKRDIRHSRWDMGRIYQVFVVGMEGEKKTIDVANSEEEFNNTTVAELKQKLAEKLPQEASGTVNTKRIWIHEFGWLVGAIYTLYLYITVLCFSWSVA